MESSSGEQTFRATEIVSQTKLLNNRHLKRSYFQWQELILSFRLSMPRCKHRHKMRWYEDSFTGREAVEWLHTHLQSNDKFGSVSKEQVQQLMCMGDILYTVYWLGASLLS